MLRLTRIHEGPIAAGAPVHVLRLTYDERAKSRLAAMCENGTAAAILLARGTVLRDGTVLAGDEDAYAVVRAAPQPLARITAATPLQLMRAVYHLANRHVPVQLGADSALIERDAVLERMLRALEVRIEYVEAPFDPEAGAYGGHGHHHHDTHDEVAATVGEQLSIEAHRARSAGAP